MNTHRNSKHKAYREKYKKRENIQMHSIYVALIIIFPTLHVMVMQNHISGWSTKPSLEYKLRVPISDIYCICIYVSHDLLVLSKHTKHGHCPISRFFASVSSLILFLSSTILRFSSLFHCLFYCNMLLNSDMISGAFPFCLSLSLKPFHCFDRCDQICTWISVNCILMSYIWRSWTPTLIPTVMLVSVFVARVTAGTFEVGLVVVVEVVVWPRLT